MSGKVSAQTAHTFSHTVVCLLKIYLTHGDVKTTQMHIILQKERERHTHTHSQTQIPHTVNTPGTTFITRGYAAATGANTTRAF